MLSVDCVSMAVGAVCGVVAVNVLQQFRDFVHIVCVCVCVCVCGLR